MGLKDRLRKLEGDATLGGTLHLPDGTTLSYDPYEMLDALLAAVERGDHRLLPYLRQMDTNEGMAGLVKAMEGDDSGAYGP